MKSIIIAIGISMTMFSCESNQIAKTSNNSKMEASNSSTPMSNQSIYDFKVEDIDGETFDFSTLKGKKVLIVNTASKCGFTGQYEQLEEIYKEYGDDNFTIIGFPANNFMGQEPGSNEEIATFCQLNYGVTFPMMAKISVKGKDQHPIYKYLTSKEENGVMDSDVKWNFQKYLINEEGQVEKVFYSKTKPNDPEIINWITKS